MRDKVIYMFLLGLLSIVGLTYGNVSTGLAAKAANGPFYCDELLSSGGDDTAMIIGFALFFIPLVLRFVRFFQDVSVKEVWLFYTILVLSVFFLFLATLDCEEIFYTAFGIPDLYLAIALIALPASALMLWKIRSE